MRGTKKNNVSVTMKDNLITLEFKENNKERMVSRLLAYINAIMSDFFPSYVSQYSEDLFQEGVVAILENFNNYDISKGAPTTYFKMPIVHAMYEYIASQVHGISTYYLKEISDLDKVLKYHECSFEEISEEEIMKELGYTKEKYEIISYMYKIVHEEFNIPTDYFNNIPASENIEPENIITSNESVREIANIINELTDEKKKIIINRLQLINDKKSLKKLSDEFNVSVDKIRSIYSRTLTEIRHKESFEKYYNDYKEINYSYIKNTEIHDTSLEEVTLI